MVDYASAVVHRWEARAPRVCVSRCAIELPIRFVQPRSPFFCFFLIAHSVLRMMCNLAWPLTPLVFCFILCMSCEQQMNKRNQQRYFAALRREVSMRSWFQDFCSSFVACIISQKICRSSCVGIFPTQHRIWPIQRTIFAAFLRLFSFGILFSIRKAFSMSRFTSIKESTDKPGIYIWS